MNIPVVGIYGSDKVELDSEFFHIEGMSGRFNSFKGRIKPHIHRDLFQIMVAIEGDCMVTIEDEQHRVHGASALYIPGGTVHSIDFNAASKGWTITASEQLFSRYSESQLNNMLEPLTSSSHVIHFTSANASKFSRICWLLESMQAEYSDNAYGRDVGIASMLDQLLLLLTREVVSGNDDAIAESNQQKLFVRFKKQIEINYTCHLRVKNYADRLGLTEPRLNRICHRFSGKTAHELIQSRLLLEAKRLLIYSSASATEISFRLGFRDPAYFNRFFKRSMDVSPIKFRAAGVKTKNLRQAV